MIRVFIVAFIILVLFAISSIVLGIFSGWYKVKHQPREPMYLCPVHGPIPKSATIVFCDYQYDVVEDDEGNIVDSKIGDYQQCAICFHNKLTQAERIQ